MQADASVRRERTAHLPIAQLEIEPLRVEVAADPAFGLTVLGMARIGRDLQEPGVAVNTANILRRSFASAIDAAGHARCRLMHEHTFELDRVVLSEALSS